MNREEAIDDYLRFLTTFPVGFSTSSAPLSTLSPIQVSELQLNWRARGRVLHGVLVLDPRKLTVCSGTQVLTILQDSSGRGVRVSLRHVIQSNASDEEINAAFPLGARVAIKEPALTYFASPSILVDNPADLVVLSYLGDSQAELLQSMSPAEIRTHGNNLFKAGSFQSAAEAYGMSSYRAMELELDDPQDQLLALSSLAECYFKLGRFEDCIDVVDEALALDPAHCKTIFQKASALIELHLYDWAAELLESFSGEIDTIHESSIGELRSRARKLAGQSRSGAAVLEEITGYVEQVATVRSAVKFPELAEYVGPVEVRKCRDQRFNRGRGLFATRDITKGEVVIVSKSAISEPGSFHDKVARLLELATKSPRRHQQLSSLAGKEVPEMKLFSPNWITAGEWSSYRGSGNREEMNVKKMYQVASASRADDDRSWSGDVSLLEEFINHSCIPNVCETSSGEPLYMLAAREIAAGEEIVVSYFSSCHAKRKEALERCGIRCDCMKCKVERKVEPELEEVIRVQVPRINNRDEPSGEAVKMVVMKLEEVLNSVLESEDERQCLRSTVYSSFYQVYYVLESEGKVEKLPGVPPAEVLMAASQKFSAGNSSTTLVMLEFLAEDKISAAKIMREQWECKFGVVKDDLVYEAAKFDALLNVKHSCCS